MHAYPDRFKPDTFCARRLLPLTSCWPADAFQCAPGSHCHGSDPCSRSSAPDSRSSVPGSPSSAPGSPSSAPGSWWRVPGSRSGVLCCWRICPRSWSFSTWINRQTWCNGNGRNMYSCKRIQLCSSLPHKIWKDIIQCSGSGTTGSTCFWASQSMMWILDSYCFATSFGIFIFEKWCKCTFKNRK